MPKISTSRRQRVRIGDRVKLCFNAYSLYEKKVPARLSLNTFKVEDVADGYIFTGQDWSRNYIIL